MAEIIPYPLARRVARVHRLACQTAQRPPQEGEKHLRRQVEVQRETLLNYGVTPDRVDEEARAFEGAVRGRLWSLVLQGEQA